MKAAFEFGPCHKTMLRSSPVDSCRLSPAQLAVTFLLTRFSRMAQASKVVTPGQALFD